MRYFIIASFLLLLGCEKQPQHSYDSAMESSAEEKLRALHKSSRVSISSALPVTFVTESVTAELADQIEKSLVKFTETDGYPEGFEHIEEVSFSWLNIAGIHTRRAEFGDIFFFPRLDVAEEDRRWISGVALKRGSNIAYRWELDEHERTNKTDAGNGSKAVCRVIDGCQRPPALSFGLPLASYVAPLHSRSPSPDPRRQPLTP